VPVSKGERSMRGGSWFPRGGAARGCSNTAVCGGGRQSESSDGGATSWTQRVFGSNTIVEIKQVAEIEWARKERFLSQNKIVKKNLGCCCLNKKTLELKT
jgi:hypothetical protein